MHYLLSGWYALADYLSAHVLTCLVPAFFIAGAIAVFVSQAAVMKYFGARAKKSLAYAVASVSGAILAVCSCTILPLFAGIRQRGAGLGPAVTFLYSGPAINVLAIVYSARLLGMDIGVARTVGAVAFSILIGLIMAFLFRREEEALRGPAGDLVMPEDERKHPLRQVAAYFTVMVLLLVSASSIGLIIGTLPAAEGRGAITLSGKPFPAALTVILLGATVALSRRWYASEEISRWMAETWKLARKIIPVLLLGVFIAGMVKELLPQSVVQRWVGGNSLGNNLLAAVFGTLMYFSTLTEVPIVKALTDLGMGRGPALTLLLAGPSLSLPSIIVIGRVMGVKRTAVYVLLVIILSTTAGMVFGMLG
ncbi:MAG: permease [Candidatus Zixiibacteriota bacterium]|nr:MAG: permease [candidate division Zixibacteria bacterium]